MGFWDPIDNAKSRRNSEFIRGGRYLMQIQAFKGQKNRDGRDAAIFEFLCLACTDDVGAAPFKEGPHRPGDKVSWMLILAKDAAWPTLKAALATILGGVRDEEVTAGVVEKLASSANPLAGMVVEIDAKQITTKGKGMPFTLTTVKRVVQPEEVQRLVPADVLASLQVKVG